MDIIGCHEIQGFRLSRDYNLSSLPSRTSLWYDLDEKQKRLTQPMP